MRKLLLASVLLSASLNAQTTFAPVGATWTYEQGYVGSYDSTLFVIQSVSDTIIQGVICSALEHTQGVSSCMPFHRYVGSIGDSVVFWSTNAGSFQTLYVFGAAIGTSWSTRADYNDGWPNTDTLTWMVTDSGSIMVDGMSLRTTEVSVQSTLHNNTVSNADGIIIERLGFSYMYPWIFGACDYEFNGPLRCYSDPGITWLNPKYPTCELGTDIKDHTAHHGITAYPTVLATDEPMNVSITDNALLGSTLEIFDALGRITRTIALNEAQQVSFTSSGAYFLRVVRPDGNVWRERVIVR